MHKKNTIKDCDNRDNNDNNNNNNNEYGRRLYLRLLYVVTLFPDSCVTLCEVTGVHHSCVTCTSMRLFRMSVGNKRTRAVMFRVARFI